MLPHTPVRTRRFASAASPLVLALLLAGWSAPTLTAQDAGAIGEYNLGDRALALAGYDPVAYFPEGGAQPARGRVAHETTHAGVLYRFASAENRERFRADPSRYAPAYGGWCAYAMSQGSKAEIDPESFRINHGRLFVFFNGFLADTRAKWIPKENVLMRAADGHWQELSGEPAPSLGRDTGLLNLDDEHLALQGYDPVSYFDEGGGEPREGRPDLQLVHADVVYRFATEENRAAFLERPERYEPVYGGWCAYAVAAGDFVEVDPESYLVRDDGLHLFYKGFLADTRAKWLEDESAFARKARAEWKRMLETDTRP